MAVLPPRKDEDYLRNVAGTLMPQGIDAIVLFLLKSF